MSSPYLDTREAAAFLGVSVPFLTKRRRRGDGPRYSKLAAGRSGSVRYLVDDLKRWMEERARG